MAVINGRGTWGVRALIPTVITTTSNWTRPTDWLALNAPTDSTEQFTGLLAITNDDSNYVTIAALSTGNYTVDWGDGTVTTHGSGTIAEKKYEYSAISETTLSSRGYKQVVVKLTGTNITTLYTNRPHSAISATATNVLNTWLEYHINLPNCTSIVSNRGGWPNGAFQTWVEKVTLNKLGNIASFSSIFNSFYSLQEVVINATTTGVTSTDSMFNECYSLNTAPTFNTSNVSNASSMFNLCYTLTTVPSYNFVSVGNGSSMFNGCYALTTVGTLDFTNATNLSSLFNSCYYLVTAPTLTTTKVTNTSIMFQNCVALETVPLFNTSTVTNAAQMFMSCNLLTSVPAFNMSLVTNFSNMFDGCYNLRSVGLIDTQRVTNWTSAFNNCNSLDELPALNLTVGNTFTSMFNGAGGISKAPFVNIRNTFTFANMMLSRTAIVDIFNGLASGVTSKTITVSGNPGYTSLTSVDRLIATGKGWTIA